MTKETTEHKEIAEQLNFLKENGKELNTTKYTYKSHELISSSYELSVTEQRIISLACKKIQPIYIENNIKPSELETALGAIKFSKIKISVNEYKREYDVNTKNIYKFLEETIKEFFEKKISYFDENNELVDKRWVSTAGYSPNNGYFYLTFNPDMLTDLLVFKGKYVALFFDMSQNIKSKYAFRIYEILKSNVYLGTYDVSVEEFKFMLKIDDKAYTGFANFRRRVIDPNIKVINEHSDIFVQFEPLRNGRTITHLRFIIKNKPNKTLSPDPNFKNRIPKSFEKVKNALKKYNFDLTSKDAEKLFGWAVEATISNKINKGATEYILEKIDYMNEYALKIKDVEDVMGFLNWAMKNDYEYKDNSIKKPKKKRRFDNFKGRDYDYDDLEKKLLGWDDYEDDNEEEDYEDYTE